MAENNLYRPVHIQRPRLEECEEISQALGLQCTREEIEAYNEHLQETFKSYDELYDMVSPTLPVKYPRTPGYRPTSDNNEYNAWYWKSEITGAPDGILKGKSYAIKDNVCVAGVPMMNGSAIMEGYVPEIDATIVTRILDAGGKILGKANNEHLCFSGSSMTCDNGPVLNPVDKTRSAGGSSSGSAVLVANGDVDGAIGGDQGGSIRIPASWCGIVGLKPTWGLVPYTGAVPIEISCDHLGPMARTVTDCALLLEAIAGYDGGRDPRQPRDIEVPRYSQLLDSYKTYKTIGMVTEGCVNCDEDVQACIREAVKMFKNGGIQVKEVSIPLHAKGTAIWGPICTEGAYNCMVQGRGVGYHYKGFYAESMMDKLAAGYKSKMRDLSDGMKMICMFGEYVKRNYGNTFYGKAQNMNMVLTEAYNKALERFDVLIMPTLPYTAPKLVLETSTIQERLKHTLGMIANTAPFDATGHPCLTINMGQSEGLPVGLMIIGKQFDETTVLQIAYRFERLMGKM